MSRFPLCGTPVRMTGRLHPDEELDGLIRRLNEAARAQGAAEPRAGEAASGVAEPPPHVARVPGGPALPRVEAEGEQWLGRLIAQGSERFATDILLVADTPPALRIHGRIEPIGDHALSAAGVAMLCAALVPPERRDELSARGALDFSFRTPKGARVRANVHRESGRWAAALRLFPLGAPDLDALLLPSSLARFAELHYGLVLVTGPTGSGKTTTLAALIERILRRRRIHLVTIEDPVEYEHEHGTSVVEHVEISRDAASFAVALRSVLRQDPDVLLIGEMRDPESIGIAITAAETGHLVLSTLHTGDGPQTIHRILDSYPPGQAEAVRAQLAASLAGIVSQQLLPRADGQGRVPAVEVLVATVGARNLIRRGRIEQLRSQMSLEQAAGMIELDHSLARLVAEGLVEVDEARARARVPEEFEQRLNFMRKST